MATVQYYFAPQSPWTYLGHLRFWDVARKHDARIEVLPVDLGGKVGCPWASAHRSARPTGCSR
jgi:2-hydroxychromene-2-carboxylate isomerase